MYGVVIRASLGSMNTDSTRTLGGQELGAWRAKYGLSRAELADRLGVTRYWIHSLELDGKAPSESLRKLIRHECAIPPEAWDIPAEDAGGAS